MYIQIFSPCFLRSFQGTYQIRRNFPLHPPHSFSGPNVTVANFVSFWQKIIKNFPYKSKNIKTDNSTHTLVLLVATLKNHYLVYDMLGLCMNVFFFQSPT